MDYFNRTVDDVFSELGTSDRGLGDGEAAMRLIASGENKLNEPKKQSVIIKFLKEKNNNTINARLHVIINICFIERWFYFLSNINK